MVHRRTSPAVDSREHWVAGVVAAHASPRPTPSRRPPLSVDRIVATALDLIEAEGFDAVTMRRIAGALQTGPASLYAHVRNKAELDDLLIGHLCAQITLPPPDAAVWRAQVLDGCRQLRDHYLRYPGISRAALAGAPHSAGALRMTEGMLALFLAGGVSAQQAAWTIDAAFLYVAAYTLETSLHRNPGTDVDGRVLDRAEIVTRLRMLPADHFPNTVAYADELTSGDHHERFEFTLELLLQGLASDRSA